MGNARKKRPATTPTPTRERKESEYASARNLFDLAAHLDRAGRISVNWITKKYKVGDGAAKRYIRFLKVRRTLRGVKQGKETFWVLAAGGAKTKDFDEVAALELALRSAPWLEGTPFYGLLADQVAACRQAVPAEQQDRLQTFIRSFSHRTQGDATYGNKREQLEALLRAIRQRRPCDIEYQRDGGEEDSYRVEPLLLVLYKDGLYLLARNEKQKRRTFAMESIASVRIDDDAPPFAIADSRFTEPEHVFRHSFGVFTDCGDPVDVELEVRRSAAMRLRRRKLHPTQQLEPLAGDWWRVHWTVARCPELTSFILSLLPDVRVRGPEGLREDVLAAARTFVNDPGG